MNFQDEGRKGTQEGDAASNFHEFLAIAMSFALAASIVPGVGCGVTFGSKFLVPNPDRPYNNCSMTPEKSMDLLACPVSW